MRWPSFRPSLFLLLLSLSLVEGPGTGCGITGGGGGDSGNEDDGTGSGSESCGSTLTLETSESSWNSSITLEDGGTTTTSTTVSLALNARNDTNIVAYYLSETNSEPAVDASGWTTVTETTDLQQTVSFTLSSGDGSKTLYGWFKDVCGDLSPVSSLTVTLDSSVPSGGLTLDGGNTTTGALTVTVRITGTSASIPIVAYALSETNGSTGSPQAPAADSSLWNTIATPSTGVTIDTSFALSATNGAHTVYGWLKSESGRISDSFSASITVNVTSLSGGITINSGATYTTSHTVSLNLSGLGPNNITGYEVSESATPSSYTTITSPSTSFSKTETFTLSTTDGTKTVYLHLKDSANTTATASATITLDGTAPTGTLKLDNGAKLTVDSIVSATITGGDAIGVVGYAISASPSPVPSPAGGEGPPWVAITSTTSLSTSTNKTLTDLTGLSTQYLWLKDAAGNVSQTISDGIEVVRVFSGSLSGRDVGLYSSIAVNSSGVPYFSFYDATRKDAILANFTNGSFGYGNIDTTGDVGSGTSIAIGSDGVVHFAYRDTTNGTLKYANLSGTNTRETIESGGISPSIGIDSLGKVHISHQQSGNVRHVTNATGSWVAQTVLSGGAFTNVSSLSLGSDDFVHIAGSSPSGLFHTTNEGGGFSSQKVASSTTGGKITVDRDNNVFIAYEGSSGTVASVISDETGGWQVTTVDSSSVDFTVVKIDSEGFTHVVFYDGVTGDLIYASDFSGSWLITTLDSSGDVGNYCDIAIDSNDRLHISYYDATNGDLKYITTAD